MVAPVHKFVPAETPSSRKPAVYFSVSSVFSNEYSTVLLRRQRIRELASRGSLYALTLKLFSISLSSRYSKAIVKSPILLNFYGARYNPCTIHWTIFVEARGISYRGQREEDAITNADHCRCFFIAMKRDLFVGAVSRKDT